MLTRRHILQTAGAGAVYLLAPRSLRASDVKQSDAIARITRLASTSEIASYDWPGRGKAPAGYVKGMAVTFARVYYNLSRNDPYATEMAKAVTPDAGKDALAHYADLFAHFDMDSSKPGPDTLRHLFVLMLGLGMRESSGRYCEGRDRHAHNTSAETAEAGLFQTSFNARHASPLLPQLFTAFSKNPTATYLDIFKEGVRAKDADLENFGVGDGRDFQQLSKDNPFFAAQFAAIGLRNIRKHWGPINRRDAEIKPQADALFKNLQAAVDADNLGPAL